jgi:BirA family transcriptional regulator, biotin operon repressor / biotin---[acetyl-CoA-carboxylase] ligase
VRADWMARAAGIGEEISVHLADRDLSGRFEALDEAGSLVLRLPDGHAETITAADVFMLA